MNPWIRLYRDSLHNPKLVTLSDRQFRAWHNLLLISNDEGELPSSRDIACHLRMTIPEAEAVLCDLVEAGLVDVDCTNTNNRKFSLHDWKAHQYVSDNSTERVRKFRNKNKGNGYETARNVSETSPEAEADTETDSEKHFAPENQPDRRSEVSKILGSLGGGGSRGVSPRLKERAEGLGLPVEEIERRALAADVREPNAMFRHVAAERLQAMLPMADRRVLKAALTKSDAAYAQVCQLLLEDA